MSKEDGPAAGEETAPLPRGWLPRGRVAAILATLFALEFVALGIRPASRSTWLLENLLVFVAVPLLALSWRRMPLSRISLTAIFLFLALHEVGSHYTYSAVPYDAFARRWLGVSPDALFGFERNHYDRLVHFAFGLLLAYPIREVCLRVVGVRGVWGYVLPLLATLSGSLAYELLEWGAAEIFGGELGHAYVGAQGDPWDAQKDMSLAALGATLAMTLTALVEASLRRDFADELARSVRVKDRRPLGEEAILRALRRRARERGHDDTRS